jgi:argininosuccinate synthase
VRIAHETGADAVAHGATGKGNDQVRFELSAYALDPSIKVIAPWRLWDLTSRTKLLEFAEANQIPIAKDKRGEAPFSVDANLLHTSSEGKVLENPAEEAPDYVYQRTVPARRGARHGRICRDHLRSGRCGGDQRRGTVARHDPDPAERDSAASMGSACWTWWKTALSA